MELLTLREVCEMVGVSRRAVQGYESLEMVRPVGKNKYGYLLYDSAAVEKIQQIKQYRDMGFSVKETKELLIVADDVRKIRILERIHEMQNEVIRLKTQIEIAEKMIQ